ncbi:MFS transporter [Kribbella sp. NPDC049227]|uniref:MFS transporter n=1 Tax=Kribbella sp. NPDC049227 TaxID=3364113 RepID=UPI0037163A17
MTTSDGTDRAVIQVQDGTGQGGELGGVVRQLGGRRAVLSAILPCAIEFYDFYIFGLLAPILAKTFFPEHDNVAGLLYVFTLFAVAFAARPIGAIMFGHIGDRHGRRNTLVISVVVMLVATVLIGLAPTYASVGILAPIWLTVARLLQGIATGGEIGGLLTYLTEVAPPGKRGAYGSVLNVASGLGTLLGVGTAKLISLFDADQVAQFGFRIPFLLSIPLALTVFLLRWGAPESPEFARRRDTLVKQPVVLAFQQHWRQMLLVIGVVFAQVIGGYGLLIYLPTYLQKYSGIPASTTYSFGILLSVLWIVLMVPMGALSDRVGRRPVLIAGGGGLALVMFPAFAMLESGRTILGILACVLIMLALTAVVGPTSAVFAEQFPLHVRYSACGVGFALASSLFGGTAPLLGTYFSSSLGRPWLFILYVAFGGLVTLTVVTLAVRETAFGDLESRTTA